MNYFRAKITTTIDKTLRMLTTLEICKDGTASSD
jgi:hypothetical protein